MILTSDGELLIGSEVVALIVFYKTLSVFVMSAIIVLLPLCIIIDERLENVGLSVLLGEIVDRMLSFDCFRTTFVLSFK